MVRHEKRRPPVAGPSHFRCQLDVRIGIINTGHSLEYKDAAQTEKSRWFAAQGKHARRLLDRAHEPAARGDDATLSGAQIEQVIISDAGSGRLIPGIGEPCVNVRLVVIRLFVGEALAPGVDAVADQAGTLGSAGVIVERAVVVHAASLDAEHAAAAMEAHVDRDAPILAGVGEHAHPFGAPALRSDPLVRRPEDALQASIDQ